MKITVWEDTLPSTLSWKMDIRRHGRTCALGTSNVDVLAVAVVVGLLLGIQLAFPEEEEEESGSERHIAFMWRANKKKKEGPIRSRPSFSSRN